MRERLESRLSTRRNPTIADTPAWRAYIRSRCASRAESYWQAGDKYQAMLISGDGSDDSRHPDQERYLITLASRGCRGGHFDERDERRRRT